MSIFTVFCAIFAIFVQNPVISGVFLSFCFFAAACLSAEEHSAIMAHILYTVCIIGFPTTCPYTASRPADRHPPRTQPVRHPTTGNDIWQKPADPQYAGMIKTQHPCADHDHRILHEKPDRLTVRRRGGLRGILINPHFQIADADVPPF